MAIGAFRCPQTAPNFRDTGAIERHIIVFPRSAVRLRYEGKPAFTADASIVTIYNRSQRYERFAVGHEGDRCDWFAAVERTVREVVAVHDQRSAESERPLKFSRTPSSASLYAAQRALFHRARAGGLDAHEGVEQIMHLFASTMASAYETRESFNDRSARTSTRRRHRELVEAARAEIARSPQQSESPHAIAQRLGTSTFHLCRVFRAETGVTMHAHRNALRVRLALEWFEPDRRQESLSAIALRVGFASHAHFVKAMREQFGTPPRALRDQLRS